MALVRVMTIERGNCEGCDSCDESGHTSFGSFFFVSFIGVDNFQTQEEIGTRNRLATGTVVRKKSFAGLRFAHIW
jgi:hypothetical protein